MIHFISKSLVRQMVFFYGLLGLICVLVAGYVTLSRTTEAMAGAELQKLASLNETQARGVREYIRSILEELTFMSRTIRIRGPFQELAAHNDAKRNSPSDPEGISGTPISTSSGRLKKSLADADDIINAYLDAKGRNQEGQEDFYLVDAAGQVFYTLHKQSDLGSDMKNGALKNSGLATLWQQIMKAREPAMSDFAIYQPTGGPAAFIGVPVFSPDQKHFYGVFVMRMGPQKINECMRLASAAGKTAESYLVGEDFLTRSNSHVEAEATMLKRAVRSDAAKLAFQNERRTMETTNYSGVPVLCAFSSVGVNEIEGLRADFKWAILTDIAVREGLMPVNELRSLQLVLYTAILIVVVLSVCLFSRAIAKPLTALTAQITKASGGDLTVQVPAKDRRDEIGLLSQAFGSMLETLADQTRRTFEGVNVLTASVAQISATASELAVNTSKTSSAVSQATTTIEEVLQAAKISSHQARSVSENTQKAVEISGSGKRATDETVLRIGMIKEQMESVGETVVRLSDRSQAIEEIISAVQDLAGQSSLLAVNASIEAARAGDQGKGFAVVAQEIKTLAGQSKTATQQVRVILEDVTKWVGAVVMATEQGARAVKAGVEQAALAGESIQVLTESVVESSQAAIVIDTSSQQQFAGIDQISSAMAHIELAMQQNLEGASQLETAAKRLEEVARGLKNLVERYRVQ